jgi:Leucine-rich repeat (LRR) protein
MPIKFTPRDYKEGYWYDRSGEAFPPRGLSDPDQYSGEERLSIVGAPSISSKDQAKLTKRWIQILPSLVNVRILWVSDKVSQIMFDAICEMQNLEALWLKWSGIKSIESVVKLKQLQSLNIGSSSQLQSITPLTQLKQLRWLELENIKQIQDISPIGECTQLLGLGIDGSMWTTQRVKSLSPVGNLSELRYLRITNLRSADKTLKPLYRLRNLQRFHAATWWDPTEIEELKRNNPRLEV